MRKLVNKQLFYTEGDVTRQARAAGLLLVSASPHIH
jgi:hypothetical protein